MHHDRKQRQVSEKLGMHKSFFDVASCVFVRQKPPFGQFLPSNTILPMIEEIIGGRKTRNSFFFRKQGTHEENNQDSERRN